MTKEQWLAICGQDASYDGKFYYGVKASKKFCRPSCPKQKYDIRRFVVFDSLSEALESGYRPCARCHPELPEWHGARQALAEAAERYIEEHYDEKFSLPDLAEALHVDKSYLLRCFKSVTGRTPLDHFNAVRCKKAAELLARPELSIAYIGSRVGFVSASHFSQVFRKYAGCTPTEYRERYYQEMASI